MRWKNPKALVSGTRCDLRGCPLRAGGGHYSNSWDAPVDSMPGSLAQHHPPQQGHLQTYVPSGPLDMMGVGGSQARKEQAGETGVTGVRVEKPGEASGVRERPEGVPRSPSIPRLPTPVPFGEPSVSFSGEFLLISNKSH